jgi:pimeloyl-ACP methyl ester carboxylesterase
VHATNALRSHFIATALLGLGVAGAAVVGTAFRSDMRVARARLAGKSRLVATACGPVEVATAGDGPPVLVVHGTAGGFDMGLRVGMDLLGDEFQVIAPSRFGYLRTPMPASASHASQADAFVALQDALDVPSAAIMALSAGAQPATQLALRHPERVQALVLITPALYLPPQPGGPETGPPAVVLDYLLAYASRVGDAAAEELLRSYEQERRPVARQILGLTRLLFWAEAGIGPLPRLLRSRLTPLAVRGLRWLPQRASLGRLALYLLAQFWVRYRGSPLSTELLARSRQLRAGNRLPDYLVDCDGRRIRLHDLTATPGVHVLLAQDSEALDSAASSSWLHVHRLDTWPGTSVTIVRPDGYIGFSACSVDNSEVAAWLGRVAVG